MINVSEVISDPDLAQAFTVFRSTGTFAPGGWVDGTVTPITMYGVVYPTTDEELLTLPEGDRVKGLMTFLSISPIYKTRLDTADVTQSGASDQVLFHGEKFKIMETLDYSSYGFWGAIGQRMKGA